MKFDPFGLFSRCLPERHGLKFQACNYSFMKELSNDTYQGTG